MIASTLLLLSAAGIGAAPAPPATAATPATFPRSAERAAAGSKARLPRFAAALAELPDITGPKGWPQIASNTAWAALAAATPGTRQAARWAYARSLIASRRGQEALGVLETMRADEPDLALVNNFRLALGAARAEIGDARGALAVLGPGAPGNGRLASNPEACAWRLWSLASLGEAVAALDQVRCSLPALNARSTAARAPFLYAGARAALAAGKPAAIAGWLKALPDGDAGANLYRGRAALALGNVPAARLRLARVTGSNRQLAVAAEVILLEADIGTGRVTPAKLARVDQLALVWRGDSIEQRLLQLSYRVGRERKDLRRSLAAGSTLVRYFPTSPGSQLLLAELQQMLGSGLAPGSRLPIAEAAGLFWDYRDLAPVGAFGDFLVGQLAGRLQQGGLYFRAAELLRHQLTERTRDIAQGPLSAEVAGLYILAGKPQIALEVLGDTDGPSFPAEMRWQRQRMAAVALVRLGRRAEALAAMQDVPDALVIRAEIFWQGRDWPALVAEMTPRMPGQVQLSPVEQTIVLRYAIALAMLGREAELGRLRLRYQNAFAGLPGAATFDLLTGDVASLTPEALTEAMLAIPSVSPAGAIGDLLDRPVVRTAAPLVDAINADSRRG